MDETNANGLQQPREEDLHHTKVSPADHTEPATPVYEGSLEKESASAKSNGDDHHDQDDVDDEKTNNGAAAESTAPTVQPMYLEGIKLYSVVISVTLATFLILLDMSIIVTAIPQITSDFHSLQDVGWYGSSYQLAAASLQPLSGKIYSNFPAKITFLSFFFIFELGSLLCGVSTSSNMLIVSRAVAGIGAAGLINGALTILSICIPLHKRPAYFGGMMGIAQMGIVIGPLLGGAFTQYTTWRWCFYVNLPIGGVVAILLLLCRIPNHAQKREISIWEVIKTKLDLPGFALFAPAAIQFFLALDYGGHQYPWNSATIIGLFCGAGGTFIVFLIWEYHRGDSAMIPFSMFQHRAVWSSCIVMFFFFGMLQLASYYLPIYFQSVKEATPMLSGVYMLPSIVSQLIGAVTSGILVSRMGYYLPWIVACGALTAIAHGLLSTLSPTTSTGKWVGYQIIQGAGRGIGFQMAIIAVQNTLPPSFVPVSMALVSFSQTFGGAVFLAIGETILTNSLSTYIPQYAPDVNPALVISAGATGIRTVVSNPTEVAGVIRAYAQSIDDIFYLAVGCSCVVFLASWGMGWKDIRKKEAKTELPPEQDAKPVTEEV